MAFSSSSMSTGGVPPGFRFHPTEEELLLYYLKKKVSLEKFDLDVIREVDLNKVEPWELQERCRIGATPQNEWYFFSHKDRKYPTGSRTNRATNAGFWKATGRDKCIRTSYKKIGMRKTLVFYRGRAPHGQKTDWIMHEYRLEETDDDQGGGSEDGWVICRVFQKKCFFKAGSNEGSSSHSAAADTTAHMNVTATSGFDQSGSLYLHHHHNQQQQQYNNPHAQPAQNLYRPELALHYSHNGHLMPKNINPYHSQQIQVQDLLPNRRPLPARYDFLVLPGGDGSAGMVDGREMNMNTNEWAIIDDNQMPQAAAAAQQRGGEMDLWGYGKD